MSNINALVVDDSPTSRTILAKVLKKMDIQCEQAKSGEEALTMLESYQPNFIFLDHLMPGLDGFETLKAIKTRPETENIPVIMYTSQHAKRYYEDAQELGAAGVISKQIDREKLYLMINSLCVQAEIESEIEQENANELESLSTSEVKNIEETAPSVFEEVTRNLEKNFDSDAQAKLLARISELETAYQEVHEEYRQLKTELAQVTTEQQITVEKSKNLSFPQFILTLFLAISLFFSSYAWLSINDLKAKQIEIETTQARANELVEEIIKVLETQSGKRKGSPAGKNKSTQNLP